MSDDKPLTTTQAAKMLGMSAKTVAKWFDSGRLPGWLVPGTRHRRFDRKAVEEFAKHHGMPLSGRMK